MLERILMIFWRRSWFGEANLDFVEFDISLKRELHFRGSEGGRQHLLFFLQFTRSVFWGVFSLFVGSFWLNVGDLCGYFSVMFF